MFEQVKLPRISFSYADADRISDSPNPSFANDPRELNLLRTTSGLKQWGLLTLLALMASATRYLYSDGFSSFLEALGKSGLLTLGFAAVGVLFGFLFGIPKSLQEKPAEATSGGGTDRETSRPVVSGERHTNIVEISDWLTKIIVGVGLTQLSALPEKIKWLGLTFSSCFGGSLALTLTAILNASVLGFFAGHIFTRLILNVAFRMADPSILQIQTVAAEAKSDWRKANYESAVSKLEKSLPLISPTTPRDSKRQFFEQLVFNCLYEDPPSGFQKAIKYAQEYLEEESGPAGGLVLAYLAMAFGQQFKWQKAQNAGEQELEQSKKAAFEAARRAIEQQPKTKGLLRMVWDQTDPTSSQEDDDLVVFFEDPGFKKLLGD